jgi:DNA invertase Pin-like site-specific DNA recombinase
MKKTRFTEAQIVAALKKHESGIPVKEICRELAVSDVTFYKWKSKYGGLETSVYVPVQLCTTIPGEKSTSDCFINVDRIG